MRRLVSAVAFVALISATQASACLPEGETLPVAAPEGYFSWDDDKMFDWFIAEYRDYCQVDSLEGQGEQVGFALSLWRIREAKLEREASKKRISKMTEKLLNRAKSEEE